MGTILNFTIYFLIFAILHSLLASDFVKTKIKTYLNDNFRFHRIIYIIISFITVAPASFIWLNNAASSSLVYSVPQELYPVIILIRLPAIGIFVYAAYQTDILEFLGLRQLFGKTKNVLITGGAYGIIRHPLYTGIIILLFTQMNMRLLELTAIFLVSIYMIIGAYIEEKRLLSAFGEEYKKYQQQVSMFIPLKWAMGLRSHL